MARAVYQYQQRLEKPDVALGILLPMNKSANRHHDVLNSAAYGDVDNYASGSIGGGGVFAQSYTTEEQSISNLKNLLLTAKGERFMQSDFGTRIRQVLFDNNTDNIRQELKDTLTEDIEFWLPYIEVSDVVITTDQDRYTLQIQLSFLITSIGANIVINILLNENSLIVSDPLTSTGTDNNELTQVGSIGAATAFGAGGGGGAIVGGGGY